MTCHGIPSSFEGSTGFTNQEFSAKTMANKNIIGTRTNGPIGRVVRNAILESIKNRVVDPAHTCANTDVDSKITSTISVESSKGINPKDKTTVIHKQKICMRKSRALPDEIKYEGWMDFTIKHMFSLEKDVFSRVVGDVMDTVRLKIEDSKSLLELVIGIDAHTLMRYIVTMVLMTTTAVFAWQSIATGAWMPFVLAGLSAFGAMYAMKEEMLSFAIETLRNAIMRRFGHKVAKGVSDEELDKLITDFMSDEPKADDSASENDKNKYEGGEWLLSIGFSILGEVLEAIMVGSLGFVAFNKKEKFVESVSKIPGAVKGISTLLELVLKWITTVVDTMFGTNASEYFSNNKELDEWARKAMELSNKATAGKLELNPSTANCVTRLIQQGRDMQVRKMITPGVGADIFRTTMRNLEQLHLTHNRVGLGVESKPEPIGLLVMGESGVGKSYSLQRLMKYVGVRTMGKEQRENFMNDFHSEVWACCNEEEHANGYKGQYFTVFDDLGQQELAPGAKSEAMSIIRMINSNPQRLNMAALHEKGNVTFTSEMIVASTNCYNFYNMNIVSQEAFLRRWKYIVQMVPRKEYSRTVHMIGGDELKSRRLDYSKLNGEFDEEAAEFHLLTLEGVGTNCVTRPSGTILSFKQLEDMIVQTFKDRRVEHKKTTDSIKKGAELRLAQVEAEELELSEHVQNLEVKYQGKADDVKRQEIINEMRIRALNGTKHMSWRDWLMTTDMRTKCSSVYTRTTETMSCVYKPVQRNFARTKRTMKEKLDDFKYKVTSEWIKFNRMSLNEKVMLISVVCMLVTLFQTAILPHLKTLLEKFCGPIKALYGAATGTFSSKVVRYKTMEEYIDFMIEDQRVFLVKAGCSVPPKGQIPEKSRTNLCKHIINQARQSKDNIVTYTRVHLDGKTGEYKLEPQYQAALFARPACYSDFAQNYVTGLFAHNIYHMYNQTADPTQHTSGGKVMMVRDKLMLINGHFVDQMEAAVQNGASLTDYMQFVPHGRPNKVIKIPIGHLIDPMNHSGRDSPEDAMLINCEPYMETHKNIVDKFVSHSEGSRLRDHEFSVFVPPMPQHMKQHDVVGTFADSVVVAGNKHSGMFWYRAPTNDGDCGGLVIETEDKNPRSRIVGIHAAGANRTGDKIAFAQRISKELLNEWASKWDGKLLAERQIDDAEYESNKLMGLHIVRKDSHRNVVMTESTLEPSYMHGWAGPATRIPAILKPFVNDAGEKLVPLEIAIGGEHGNNVPLDTGLVANCAQSVIKMLLPHMKNRGKVLSTKEAILGVEGTCLKAIARSTSAGYYGIKNPGVKPGKRGAFGTDEAYTLDSVESRKMIETAELQWEEMKKGTPPDNPYLIFLKQEKRSVKKVQEGKARIVKAASVDDVINIRRVFGHTVASIMSAHTLCGIAVGINPLGKDWDFLAKHLQTRGKRVIAGDFAKFDQSQFGQLLRAVMDILIQCAGHTDPEIKMIERCIVETLAAPRCLVGDKVYQNDHGLPSGNPLTSIMNSVFVHLAFRLVWVKIMQKPNETTKECLTRFEESITLVSYGDDHLINVVDEVCDEFNQNTLIARFPELGLSYTSDDKEDLNPPDYRNLSEVTFLKRSFRWEPRYAQYLAPLDLQTLKEVCYYSDSKGSPVAVTRDNVERIFRELALHGHEIYEDVSTALEVAHNSRSVQPVVRPPFCVAIEEVMGELPQLKTFEAAI